MWVLYPSRREPIPKFSGIHLRLSVSPGPALASHHFPLFCSIQKRCWFWAGLWPSFKRAVREPVPLQTFRQHTCCTDCRYQCRHPFLCAYKIGCCTAYHLFSMRMASSLEIINMWELFSASRYPLCRLLNVQPAAQVACKSKWWDWEEIEVKLNHLSLNGRSVADWDPKICFQSLLLHPIIFATLVSLFLVLQVSKFNWTFSLGTSSSCAAGECYSCLRPSWCLFLASSFLCFSLLFPSVDCIWVFYW